MLNCLYGFGAKSCAKGSLQISLQHVTGLGLEAEIKWNSTGRDYWGIEHGYFELWVKGDSVDVEIAKRKPGITMEETVELLKSKGVNPRVYFPFLPYND